MGTGKNWVSRAMERNCLPRFDNSTRTGILLSDWNMRVLTSNTVGRRLSESRMRENLMSGSRWQGMKTRQGEDTEALSEEMESNGSVTPKSSRHPLTLPVDLWVGCGFSSSFLASGFSCSWRESRPAHQRVTQAVGLLVIY